LVIEWTILCTVNTGGSLFSNICPYASVSLSRIEQLGIPTAAVIIVAQANNRNVIAFENMGACDEFGAYRQETLYTRSAQMPQNGEW